MTFTLNACKEYGAKIRWGTNVAQVMDKAETVDAQTVKVTMTVPAPRWTVTVIESPGWWEPMAAPSLSASGVMTSLNFSALPSARPPLTTIFAAVPSRSTITIGVRYVGAEDVEVIAGRFRAERYELRWQPRWPAAHLWVLGEDAVFLRLKWEVSGLDSQLVRLATVEAPHSPQFDW